MEAKKEEMINSFLLGLIFFSAQPITMVTDPMNDDHFCAMENCVYFMGVKSGASGECLFMGKVIIFVPSVGLVKTTYYDYQEWLWFVKWMNGNKVALVFFIMERNRFVHITRLNG